MNEFIQWGISPPSNNLERILGGKSATYRLNIYLKYVYYYNFLYAKDSN